MSVGEITTSVAYRGEIAVLSIGGEIDMASAPALETAVAAALADNPIGLIFDLSGVDFLGTAGLKILAATHEKVIASGRLAVVTNDPAIITPIQLAQLTELVCIYPTLDDAIAGMR